MLIGELATRSGCTRDTIRFYEKMGLIVGQEGNGGTNNYKQYDQQMLERLLLIQQAKRLGFTLSEIKGLAEAWETSALSRKQKSEIFQAKMTVIDERIAELKQIKQYLRRKLDALADS